MGAGLVWGTEAFACRLRQKVRGNPREQAALKRLEVPVPWPRIVAALEAVRGEEWPAFGDRHGDWGRDAALWLGRRQGRLGLGELGRLAGGLDDVAVGQAVSRFGQRLEKQPRLSAASRRVDLQLSKP